MWQEKSLIDRWDKRCSSPFFTFKLPWLFEIALTIPGSWFGATTFSLGWVGMLATVISQTQEEKLSPFDLANHSQKVFIGIFAVVTVAATLLHFSILFNKVDRKYLWDSLPLYLLLNLFIPYLLFGADSWGWRGFVFYTCSWGCTQVVSQTLKYLFGRIRPCACQANKIEPRTFDLSSHLSGGSSALESFPSGDAAGAAAFSYSMVLITGCWWWLLCAVLASVGRMYFRAHHLLDVVAGCVLGGGMTLVLSTAIGGWQHSELIHFFVVVTFFIVTWRVIAKLKPTNFKKIEFD